MTTGNQSAIIFPAAPLEARPSMSAIQTMMFAGIALRKMTPHPNITISDVSHGSNKGEILLTKVFEFTDGKLV